MAEGAGIPRRIGRYEIVGRLATGGMAEVLLGRLSGPHGFERTVVIKRILPHLTLDPSIVDMFLDEARIIAGLRHPNLLHVHELGSENGELFMAMEFLEGESVSGLCRRLACRHEQLDFSLAAHIAAEACAGLHAAHEGKSQDGRALEIVHRDISPQNLFVTYAGTVHVIDFGIATTIDRISRTEVGTVRGKFEYMSPEHAQALPLDRRADIFSLGVVLLELASGRRVYKRSSQAETMMVIMNEPVPRLSALRAESPARLEAICTRALAKKRAERYQTAAEMRRDLLGFIRKSTDLDLGEQLGLLMHDLFAERITEKAVMLQHVRQGSEVGGVPPAEVDIHVDLPTAAEAASSATELSQSVSVGRDRAPRRGRGMKLVALTGLVAAAAVGTTMAGRWSRWPHPDDLSSAASTAPEPVPAPKGDDTKGAPPAPAPPSALPSAAQSSSPPLARSDPSSSASPNSSSSSKGPVRSSTRSTKPAAPKPAPTLW